MIGILLVSHGDFSKGMVNVLEMISGEPENTIALGLYPGDSTEEFEKKINDALDQLDDGDGVIGFVDFLGGSPATCVMKCMRTRKFPCFTGANMPMLSETILGREDPKIKLDELAEICGNAGIEGLIRLDKLLGAMN
jgi:mannose/fructose/sorbose-specific phosphotransferase system IIA component